MLTRSAVKTRADPEPFERRAVCSRPSRPQAKFNPTIRCREGEPRSQHRSLVSMRTFYAFGARSASVSSSSFRSQSYTQSDVLNPLSCSRSFHREQSSLLIRSSTATSVYNSGRHTFPPYTSNLHSATLSYQSNRPSYSPSGSHVSLSTILTQRTRDPFVPSSKPKSSALLNDSKTQAHGIGNGVPMLKIIRPLIIEQNLDISDFDGKRSLGRNSHAAPASSRAEEVSASKDIRKVSETPVVPVIHEAPLTKVEMSAEDLEELTSLRERNKALEAEVLRLQSQLQDKERRERDLKRRLVESEAEAKVWKSKCEMPKPPSVEINGSSGSGGEYPNDLMDQLDSAAEKLSRLNAVKDLKMLQSEMETALKEIRDK